MRNYALATAMLTIICITSCEITTDKNPPYKQKLENKLVDTVYSDSIKTQIREAEAELKSFLEEKN